MDGISSWYIASEQKRVPLGPSYDELKELNPVVLHQVREPLASISSMLSTGSPSWHFLSKEIPINLDRDSKILKAMKYYFYWNLKAEQRGHYRVKAESFQIEILPILQSNGFRVSSNVSLNEDNRINARPHEVLTWRDLEREDEGLCADIIRMGKRYGYNVLRG